MFLPLFLGFRFQYRINIPPNIILLDQKQHVVVTTTIYLIMTSNAMNKSKLPITSPNDDPYAASEKNVATKSANT